MMLINAQGVTALTSERDAGTLELLLVTDITAKEFIVGKLGGILYNSKELILIPLFFMVWYLWQGILTFENFSYITLGFLSLVVFAAMLGLHSGLSYTISRTAIANSLGTMFFLFVGIFICMIAASEFPGLYSGRKSRALGLAHSSKSITRLDACCWDFAVLYVLCHHKLSAGTYTGCLPVRCGGLWFYDHGHVDSRGQRI